MGKLHLNIVLPAVFVSCTVFSALTLPFVLSDSSSLSMKLPPPFQGEVEPIFQSENKTIAIRYLGFAIVSSVGAGLITVEALRRLQAVAPKNSIQDNSIQDMFVGLESDLLQSTALSSALPFEPEFSIDTDAPDLGSSHPELTAFPPDAIPVLEEHGQTCRIKLSQSEQTQFALSWNGEYYRFFRVQATQEKALNTAKQLARRGEHVVVSPLDQGYAVWTKTSEQPIELVS